MKLRDYQQEAVEAAQAELSQCYEPCLIEAATGCHRKGTLFIMSNGSFKAAEDVCVGDKLLNPAGGFNEVMSLCRGFDSMYKVTPTKGDSFYCNGGHILHLEKTPTGKKNFTTGSINLTVNEYLNKNKTFKHTHKIKRNDLQIEFDVEPKPLPIPAYMLGLFLGDGHIGSAVGITTEDKEIVSSIYKYAEEVGLNVVPHFNDSKTCPSYNFSLPKGVQTRGKGKLQNIFRAMGLWKKKSGNKFIPSEYKTAQPEDRLKLLAGLIDSDGSLSSGCFDYLSKSETLSNDVAFICRSLGLSSNVTKCRKSCKGFSGVYYRVCISGDCHIIPTKLPRKKCGIRNQKKRNSVTGFKIEKVSDCEPYYGVRITGNHLYFLHDFTITHNSGKSHIIAAVAHWLHQKSGKKILCLAPSAELVEQNHEKYLQLGEKASIYSASIQKSLRHDVVFGTPITVLNSICRFRDKFAAVIVDEAHGITPTIKTIIEELKSKHKNLRVLGLTATPYRMGTGYIYQYDETGKPVPETQTHEPYFNKLVYSVDAPYLISKGFLNPPVSECTNTHYDTSKLEIGNDGKYTPESVEGAFVGKGRLTADIVADVVERCKKRHCVMLFASTVQHANEIMESLPKELSRIVTGETKNKIRKQIIKDSREGKVKYLVSVGALTTGVDIPRVDAIAILRATESASLLQQIAGRGARLCPEIGKTDFLFLDYAENIERHCPDGDIFNPEIKASYQSRGEHLVSARCPDCGTVNEFGGRENKEGFQVTEEGYFCDLTGEPIVVDKKPMPAHYGRRCYGQTVTHGTVERCGYRWSSKECLDCGHHNDIAARYCEQCKSELIDPNEKLVIEHKKLKKDPYSLTTDKVLSWDCVEHMSAAGNKTMKVTYTTEYRTFSAWYMERKKSLWIDLCLAVYGKPCPDISTFLKYVNSHGRMPVTVTVRREQDSKFFTVFGHNREEDLADNEGQFNEKHKPVINSDGVIFNSLKEAAEYIKKLGLTSCENASPTIGACARGDIVSAYGFNWSYNICVKPERQIKKNTSSRNRQVINSDGDIFSSIPDAAIFIKATGKSGASLESIGKAVWNAIHGKRTEAYGLGWSHDIENIPIGPVAERPFKGSDGNTYKSIDEAAIFLTESGLISGKISARSSVSSCLKGKSGAVGGIKFTYDLDHMFDDTRIVNSNGDIFDNIEDCVRWISERKSGDINGQLVRNCINGKAKSAYGFAFSYLRDGVPVDAYCVKKVINDKGFVFNSTRDAARYVIEVDKSSNASEKAVGEKIRCTAAGSQKTAYGYKWEYVD